MVQADLVVLCISQVSQINMIVFQHTSQGTQALIEFKIIEQYQNQAPNTTKNGLWGPAALGTNGPNNRWFHHLQSCKTVNIRSIAWKDY